MKTYKQYQLILHDFGNLALQVIDVDDKKEHLDQLCDRINWLFNHAGNTQFKAELVCEEIEEIEDEQ